MCGPLATGLLSFGLGAAQTVVSYSAARQEARATREAAEEANRLEQEALTEREMQEQDALAQKKKLQNIDQAEREAEVLVAAGETSGISLDNLVADVRRNAARNRETEEANTRNTIAQLQRNKEGSASKAQSRINAAPNPSPGTLVAGLGGAALSGVNTYNRTKFMT